MSTLSMRALAAALIIFGVSALFENIKQGVMWAWQLDTFHISLCAITMALQVWLWRRAVRPYRILDWVAVALTAPVMLAEGAVVSNLVIAWGLFYLVLSLPPRKPRTKKNINVQRVWGTR